MFNSMKICSTISSEVSRRIVTRSIYKCILSPELHFSSINTRFYCHAHTIDEQNLSSTELHIRKQNLDKQKLDELLSDPENNKRFQILELEVDVLRHNAERVPNNIKPKDWLLMLNTMHKTKRKKYLEFLWRNERKAENQKIKKELKKEEWLSKIEELEEGTSGLKYGLQHNTLFMRIYETTINRFYNGKLLQSMMFEPKVVFDCGYEDDMTEREIHNCAKQLSLAFASNRNHIDPAYFYFCNFNYDGILKRYLHQNIPTLMQDDFPVTITSQSYLDVFPKNRLVYLTPHCRVNLTKYDPDMVYIIGALVDKGNSQPYSLAKAKREGIQMAKFPIDKYLEWGSSSSKSLTLDQSIKIMLDLKRTGDWNKALENVPHRKLKASREQTLRHNMRKLSNTSETQEPKVPIDFTFESRNMD